MIPTSECAFTRWFCKAIKEVNGKCIAFVASKLQEPGLPDRFVSHRRIRAWCEFKRNDYRLRDVQRAFIMKLSEHGNTCFVVRCRHEQYCVDFNSVEERLLVRVDLRKLEASKVPGKLLLDAMVEAEGLIGSSKIKHSPRMNG